MSDKVTEPKVFYLTEDIFALMTETMAWAPKNIGDPAFMVLKGYLEKVEEEQKPTIYIKE